MGCQWCYLLKCVLLGSKMYYKVIVITNDLPAMKYITVINK